MDGMYRNRLVETTRGLVQDVGRDLRTMAEHPPSTDPQVMVPLIFWYSKVITMVETAQVGAAKVEQGLFEYTVSVSACATRCSGAWKKSCRKSKAC